MLKRHVVINAPKIKRIKIEPTTILLFTLFICGIILSVMITKIDNEQWQNLFNELLKTHIKSKTERSSFNNFISVFAVLSLILLFDYICGLCGLGVPFIYLSPLMLGIILGTTICQYYICFGLTGIGYCILINLPCYAITAATLIKCCCFSKEMSEDIFFYLISGKKEKSELSLKNYTIKYIIFTVVIAFAGIINTVSFRLFSKLFTFI